MKFKPQAQGRPAAFRIDEALFRVSETAALRRAAAEILTRAVDAVDPYAATLRALTRSEKNPIPSFPTEEKTSTRPNIFAAYPEE